MEFTITYKDDDQMFYMNDKPKMFVGEHLEDIGRELKIKELDDCLSEGHMLAVLQDKGVQINIVEEDGSRMDW